MGARADGSASGTTPASPEDVWHRVSDGSRLVSWWPRAERVEDVQGGIFTLVLRSTRGVPVRTDWHVARSRRPELQRWEQALARTPFAKALVSSAVEVRIEPGKKGGSTVTVAIERELVAKGAAAGLLGRRASKRHAGEALRGLLRSLSSAG